LGDPYGTLVLTLSIVGIEVILISAVMLGPGDHHTIARDSVMATVMIVLNLVIGLALIVGGMRHSNLQVNRAGISAYLSTLVVLIASAFGIPADICPDGAYTAPQPITIVTLTVLLYAFYHYLHTGTQHAHFTETDKDVDATNNPGIAAIFREHKGQILTRALL